MCCRVVQQQQQQHVTHQPAVRKGTGKRRRRLCRLCCLAVTLVISFGIYLLAVFAASIVATVPFDPRNQLALQVWREALQAMLDDTDAGCDHTDTLCPRSPRSAAVMSTWLLEAPRQSRFSDGSARSPATR